MGIKSLDLIPHRSFLLQVGTRTNLSNMTVTVAQADADELPVNATISIENDIGLQPAQRKNPLARRNPFDPNPVPPSALGAELSVYLDESEYVGVIDLQVFEERYAPQPARFHRYEYMTAFALETASSYGAQRVALNLASSFLDGLKHAVMPKAIHKDSELYDGSVRNCIRVFLEGIRSFIDAANRGEVHAQIQHVVLALDAHAYGIWEDGLDGYSRYLQLDPPTK